MVDRSEENCRQILRRARERLTTREPSAEPEREENQRVVSEFLNAAETGQFEQLLNLLSDGAALAPAPPDLSKPAPPLIYDRKILFQALGNSLATLRQGSDRFAFFQVGQDYACVARSGAIVRGAIILRVLAKKVAGVRVVICPALLNRLKMLMTASTGGDGQPEGVYQSN